MGWNYSNSSAGSWSNTFYCPHHSASLPSVQGELGQGEEVGGFCTELQLQSLPLLHLSPKCWRQRCVRQEQQGDPSPGNSRSLLTSELHTAARTHPNRSWSQMLTGASKTVSPQATGASPVGALELKSSAPLPSEPGARGCLTPALGSTLSLIARFSRCCCFPVLLQLKFSLPTVVSWAELPCCDNRAEDPKALGSERAQFPESVPIAQL